MFVCRRLFAALSALGLILGVVCLTPSPAAAQPVVSDLDDDGRVNVLDIFEVLRRFNLQAGQARYREGLDLVPDGVIDAQDYLAVIADFGASGVPVDGTIVSGRVFDGSGNPLSNVLVKVGLNTVTGLTDEAGVYSLAIPPNETGESLITFDGSAAVDPTPDLLSGLYPTIPNKPIFVNGGTNNVFREMSLPERDLTGSVPLDGSNAIINGNSAELLEDILIDNAGVRLLIPAGCTAVFPPGEVMELSITRVGPARLPVPMPPLLQSSIFVTYQPGGTEILCPAGTQLTTDFDNVDAFEVANPPFLAGITNGVFTFLSDCTVSSDLSEVNCGPIGTPFDFAWYHVDVPTPPCPRTTVVGAVRLNNAAMDPLSGATVSVPGVGPVTTDASGAFSIPNVPAGPNGIRCFSSPFSLRASASKDLDSSGGLSTNELGVSPFLPAVPGGATDVGVIKLGVVGTVQGSVTKLTSVSPFVVIPLPGAEVDVDSDANDPTSTDTNGNYNIPNVPVGGYNVSADFAGDLPVPGGGIVFKEFSGTKGGNIDFAGDLDAQDFRFTSHGDVEVTLVSLTSGNPIPGEFVRFNALGGDLGGGFVAPTESRFGNTDSAGVVLFDDVPQGPCEITVFGNFGATVFGPDVCFVNQHGELLSLNLVVDDSTPGDMVDLRFDPGSSNLLVDVKFSLPVRDTAEDDVDLFIQLDFDTDQNPNTGPPSNCAPSAGIGVDLVVRCSLDGCEMLDGDGSFIAPFDGINLSEDNTLATMSIPTDLLSANGATGLADMVAMSRLDLFGGEVAFADILPNEGSVEVDFADGVESFEDPVGDTFSPFDPS